MTAATRPRLASLFGGASRVRVLGVLANGQRPMSAYRISRIGRVPPPKVYRVLRQLKEAGLASQVPVGPGRSAWELSDPYLRAFLVRQVRIIDLEDLARGPRAASGVEAARIARMRPLRLSRYRPDPGRASSLEEFLRPAEKDVELKARGLPTSRRRRRPT